MIFGLTLTFTTPTWATETCAGGAGTVITGKDGITQYCLSPKEMNWWSANAWCDALGMELFNIQTECNKVIGTTKCPQILDVAIRGSYGYAWTQNVPSGGEAFYIAKTGRISSISRGSDSLSALCMSKN